MARLFGRGKKEGRRGELLSAYLDGELSDSERARLEAQLADDPALRAELDGLRQTVALVRGLPPVPAPRNFLLPQTTAARPHPATARALYARPAPWLTAAAAIASFLFIALLSLDLLLPGMSGNLALSPAPQMAADSPREMPVTVVVEAEPEGVAEVAPPTANETPPQALSESSAGADEPDEAPAPAGAPATAPAEKNGALTATPTSTPSPGADGRAATPSPSAAALGAADAEGEGENRWDAAPVEEERAEPPDDEMAGTARPASLRSLEIALGLIALVLASAAVWDWRRPRP